MGCLGALVDKIPIHALARVLRESSAQNFSDSDKLPIVLVDEEKIALNQCDSNMPYLLRVLKDKSIPYEEKVRLARVVIDKYLNLKTPSGRLNFVLCVVSVLSILFQLDTSGYHVMIANLIDAVRSGKISKAMAKLIYRRLLRQGVDTHPDLEELLNS